MEKKYKYYMTKSEKFFLGFAILFIISIIIGGIFKNRYDVFFYLLPATAIFFTIIRYYRLTDDNMLILQRYLFGNAFKPVSVSQITRVNQKKPNQIILIYYRNKLRGDIILKLSETDLKDFLNELQQRNPSIEISANNS